MNIDRDLILAKINNIQNCLNSIKTYTRNFDINSLDEIMVQDLVVLNLERAIQACIDIALHILSREALGVPLSMGDAFFSLYKNSFISEELSKNLIKMVGFRNIAVHEYQRLDLDILKSVVKNNLKDFEEFYKIILEKTKSN
ncbi:MAG: hypothetical protein RLZZ361_318 [Cyanobacteriota bacterium]|jgi:uncharacterized protein YutE (UPF0331/DUF86 family)